LREPGGAEGVGRTRGREYLGDLQDRHQRASGLTEILWVLAIVILPVVGFIVWLIAGPRGPSTRPVA
jgi:hypothetical protein